MPFDFDFNWTPGRSRMYDMYDADIYAYMYGPYVLLRLSYLRIMSYVCIISYAYIHTYIYRIFLADMYSLTSLGCVC